MSGHKAISQRLLIAAIFVGLNALCFLGVAHGHRVHRHTRVNYSHIPHASRSGSRYDRSGGVTATVDLFEHVDLAVATQTHQAAVVLSASSVPTPVVNPAASPVLVHPEENVEPLLVRENVLALGSAPRAPGLGRAPPTA
jgi:hypothetical protein